jgi:hypothetical protein
MQCAPCAPASCSGPRGDAEQADPRQASSAARLGKQSNGNGPRTRQPPRARRSSAGNRRAGCFPKATCDRGAHQHAVPIESQTRQAGRHDCRIHSVQGRESKHDGEATRRRRPAPSPNQDTSPRNRRCGSDRVGAGPHRQRTAPSSGLHRPADCTVQRSAGAIRLQRPIRWRPIRWRPVRWRAVRRRAVRRRAVRQSRAGP